MKEDIENEIEKSKREGGLNIILWYNVVGGDSHTVLNLTGMIITIFPHFLPEIHEELPKPQFQPPKVMVIIL